MGEPSTAPGWDGTGAVSGRKVLEGTATKVFLQGLDQTGGEPVGGQTEPGQGWAGSQRAPTEPPNTECLDPYLLLRGPLARAEGLR